MSKLNKHLFFGLLLVHHHFRRRLETTAYLLLYQSLLVLQSHRKSMYQGETLLVCRSRTGVQNERRVKSIRIAPQRYAFLYPLSEVQRLYHNKRYSSVAVFTSVLFVQMYIASQRIFYLQCCFETVTLATILVLFSSITHFMMPAALYTVVPYACLQTNL